MRPMMSAKSERDDLLDILRTFGPDMDDDYWDEVYDEDEEYDVTQH